MTELDSFLAWVEDGEKRTMKNNFAVGLLYSLFKGMLKRMIEEYRKVEAEWLRT